MRKINNSATPVSLALAAILALGVTCAWIIVSFFPITLLIEPWIPGGSDNHLWITIAWLLSPLMIFILFVAYLPLKAPGTVDVLRISLYLALPTLLVLAASIAASIQTYRRHSRISETGAITWAIFVLFWGIPGYIGYLAHRRWPVMERCSSCILDTPRDRDDCLHCHMPFPPPARVGTEIFA